MVVGPTNRNPRFRRATLSAVDSVVIAGISLSAVGRGGSGVGWKLQTRSDRLSPRSEDSNPAQTRLESLQADLLKHGAITAERRTPLLVVVPHVLMIVTDPRTAGLSI